MSHSPYSVIKSLLTTYGRTALTPVCLLLSHSLCRAGPDCYNHPGITEHKGQAFMKQNNFAAFLYLPSFLPASCASSSPPARKSSRLVPRSCRMDIGTHCSGQNQNQNAEATTTTGRGKSGNVWNKEKRHDRTLRKLLLNTRPFPGWRANQSTLFTW